MKQISLILALTTTLISCNKENRYSRRLMTKDPKVSGTWDVKELSVDGVNDTIIPYLVFFDGDIYSDTCTGQWISGSMEADFTWQFKNKGKNFQIERINGADSANFITDISEIECYRYSGKYDVIKARKKEMIFESTSTVGYSGKKVRIRLQLKE